MPSQAGGICNRTATRRKSSSKEKANYGFCTKQRISGVVIQIWKAFVCTVNVGDLSLFSRFLTLQG